MTVLHVVLFRFLPTTTAYQKSLFLTNVKTLRSLSCVKDGRLIISGPSISEPKEVSQGYEYALVSWHRDRSAVEEYQASEEHERVVSTYLRPYKDNVIRFDFEVPDEDEHLLGVMSLVEGLKSK